MRAKSRAFALAHLNIFAPKPHWRCRKRQLTKKKRTKTAHFYQFLKSASF